MFEEQQQDGCSEPRELVGRSLGVQLGKNFLPFVEPEGSLPCSQELAAISPSH
jgi:hypothetical protein